ncbi:MAG TPA: GPP34 family phosphoprotein [Stellaceae bacterium]|nr:GPP34 family phosphoprotein [Stellaceae bacterium]
MLTFAEELLLLAHDEKSGGFANIQDLLMNTALAGAVLMDLAILNRIDTDLSTLVTLDRTPTGEKLLDYGLTELAALPAKTSTIDALDLLRKHGATFEQMAIARLIERGILREQGGRILWVFETRRYPLIDGKELQEVKRRIADLLLSDDIPDSRDVVIIALAQACGLLRRVFSESELRDAQKRIDQIAKLDLIGQAMSDMMSELSAALTRLLPYS